jgi:hypothetical protein
MPGKPIKKITFTAMVPMTVDFYPEDFETKKDWVNFRRHLRRSRKNAENAFFDNVSPDDAKDALETTNPEVTWKCIY